MNGQQAGMGMTVADIWKCLRVVLVHEGSIHPFKQQGVNFHPFLVAVGVMEGGGHKRRRASQTPTQHPTKRTRKEEGQLSEANGSSAYDRQECLFDWLPPELVEKILLHADPVSRVVCRFVCRLWAALLPVQAVAFGPAFSAHLAAHGMWELLKWGREPGCLWDISTSAAAAGAGCMEMLKWMRASGCPWDSDTAMAAAEGGHLEVLQWLNTNQCLPRTDVALRAAAKGHVHIIVGPLTKATASGRMNVWRLQLRMGTSMWCNGRAKDLIHGH